MERKEIDFHAETDAELLRISKVNKADIALIETILKDRALSRLSKLRRLFQQALKPDDVTVDTEAGTVSVVISMSQWGVNDDAKVNKLQAALGKISGTIVKRDLFNVLDFSRGYFKVTFCFKVENQDKPGAEISDVRERAKVKVAGV